MSTRRLFGCMRCHFVISCVHMRRSAVAVVVVVGLVVAGCGGGSDDEPASTNKPTTTKPTTSPTTQDQQAADEKELRKLAEDWNEVRIGLLSAEDPDFSRLHRYVTGRYAADFEKNLSRVRRNGFVVRVDPEGRAAYEVESVSVDGGSAKIVECVVDSNVLVRIADGSTVNDDVESVRLNVVAERTNAGWRLAAATPTQTWQGVAGCAG